MDSFNYAEIWKSAMTRKTASGNPYREKPETAVSYDRSEKIWADGYARAAAFPVEAEDTVLDIGSGPGVLAIPLARRVKAVTAVEPSETMVELMLGHARDKGVQNLRVVNCRWEDADLEQLGSFDHVIASYSLNMPDMETALVRMNAVAHRQVWLYWFCGIASWERIRIDLSPAVHGREFVPGPKADLLYGMLSNLGISASIIDLDGTSFDRDFPDMKTAIRDIRNRLEVTTGKWDDLFEAYIRTHHEPLDNGGWRYVDRTHYVCIHWTPVNLRVGIDHD